MIHDRRTLAILLAFVLVLLPGCGKKAQATTADLAEISIRETVTEANPQAAVDEIYAEVVPNALPTPLSNSLLDKKLPKTSALLTEQYGAISDPNGGLADVIILRPSPNQRDAVREALNLYKDTRINEFENYDILDAFEIARNALVIDQSDYVILLMLPDNEAAQDILDKHIPL